MQHQADDGDAVRITCQIAELTLRKLIRGASTRRKAHSLHVRQPGEHRVMLETVH